MKIFDKIYIKSIIRKVAAAKEQGLKQLIVKYDPSHVMPYPLNEWIKKELLDKYQITVKEIEWSNKDYQRFFKW